jgi:hypothetical protein
LAESCLVDGRIAGTRLIALDHDLDPVDGGVADPGTGFTNNDWRGSISALVHRHTNAGERKNGQIVRRERALNPECAVL